MAFEGSSAVVDDCASSLGSLDTALAACRICRDRPTGPALPHEPRPIYRISSKARLLIASQAPGMRAHASGVPFDDASGRRLRAWLDLAPEEFYDPDKVMIVPMGFCFPGYDAHGGDLPPRRECRQRWHDELCAALPQVELILAIGTHAIRYHMARLSLALPGSIGMTNLVLQWRGRHDDLPRLIPLPHPSWRNTAWLNRNPAFEAEILPVVRQRVRDLVGEAPPRPQVV